MIQNNMCFFVCVLVQCIAERPSCVLIRLYIEAVLLCPFEGEPSNIGSIRNMLYFYICHKTEKPCCVICYNYRKTVVCTILLCFLSPK